MKSYQIALLATVGNGVLFASLLLYAYVQHNGSLAFINWTTLCLGTLAYGLALSVLAWFGGWLVNVLLVYPKKPLRNYVLSQGWIGALFFAVLLALVCISATKKGEVPAEAGHSFNLGALEARYLYGAGVGAREFHSLGYTAPAVAAPDVPAAVAADAPVALAADASVPAGDPEASTVLVRVKDTVLRAGGDTLHMVFVGYPLKDRREWYSKVHVLRDTAYVELLSGLTQGDSAYRRRGRRNP